MKELEELAKKNPMPVLLSIYDKNPKGMVEQFKISKYGEKSFFISMLEAYSDTNFAGEFLDFSVSLGYDLKAGVMKQTENNRISSDMKVNQPKEIKEKIIPEWFLCMSYLSQEDGSKFLDYLGKDFIVANTKKYNVLEWAYYKKKFLIIKKLSEFGIDDENSFGGENIKRTAIQNKDLFELYTKLKSNINKGDEFLLIKEKFIDLLSKINSSMYDTKDKIKDACEFLADKFPLLNREQQELLTMHAVGCKTTSVYAKAVNLLGSSKNSYKPQYIKDWSGLNDDSTHEFVHLFLDKKIPFNETTDDGDNFLALIADKLHSLGVLNISSYDKSAQAKRNKSLKEKVFSIISHDLVFSDFSEDSSEGIWYHKMMKYPETLSFFQSSLLNLNLLDIFKHIKAKKESGGSGLEVFDQFGFSEFQHNSNNANIFKLDNVDNYLKLLQSTALKQDEKSELKFIFDLRNRVGFSEEVGASVDPYHLKIKSYSLNLFREMLSVDDVYVLLNQDEKDMMIKLTLMADIQNRFQEDEYGLYSRKIFQEEILSKKALKELNEYFDNMIQYKSGALDKSAIFINDFKKYCLTKELNDYLDNPHMNAEKKKIKI